MPFSLPPARHPDLGRQYRGLQGRRRRLDPLHLLLSLVIAAPRALPFCLPQLWRRQPTSAPGFPVFLLPGMVLPPVPAHYAAHSTSATNMG